jgi:putative membrane protein
MKRWLVGALVVTACGGATQEAPPVVTTTSAIITTDQHRTPPNQDTLGDDEVLGIIAVFNTNAIDLADLASERGADARVRRLAALLGDAHRYARDEEARMSEQLSMQAASSDRTRVLRESTTTSLASLRTLSGGAFDAAWLRHAARAERDGLALMDFQLLPSVRVPDMQAHLAALRERVDHHLRDVEDLQQSMRP